MLFTRLWYDGDVAKLGELAVGTTFQFLRQGQPTIYEAVEGGYRVAGRYESSIARLDPPEARSRETWMRQVGDKRLVRLIR